MPKDRLRNNANPFLFGRGALEITPADQDLAEVARAVEVTGVGSGARLDIMPPNSSTYITYDPVTVGFVPKFQVRRVGPSTTCDVVAIYD